MKWLYILLIYVSNVLPRNTAIKYKSNFKELQTGKDPAIHNCSKIDFKANKTDVQNMVSAFEENQSLMVKTNLNFNGNGLVKAVNGTILPSVFVMTRLGKHSGSFFTAWPVDYNLVSFNLLDSRTLTNIILNIDVHPRKCNVTIGDLKTEKLLMKELLKIKVKTKPKMEQNHMTKWCYMKVYPGMMKGVWYQMKIYAGFPSHLFGFRCCQYETIGHLDSNPMSENKFDVICKDEFDMGWDMYLLLPYYLGIIFFCFLPIFLMQCGARAMDSGQKIKISKRDRYIEFHNDQHKWTYLRNKSPISICLLVLSVCGLADRHPVAASKIRKVLLVFCSPCLIYNEILMYRIGWPEFIPALNNENIPMGFASIAGGIGYNPNLFFPFTGGPFLTLVVYFVVALIVIVLPRDVGDIFEKGLGPDKTRPHSLFHMNIVTIQELSHQLCTNRHGYRQVYAVLKANIFMLVNPHFYLFAVKFIKKRWEKIQRFSAQRLRSKWLLNGLLMFIFLPYFVLSAIELVVFLIYCGIPLLKFLNTIITGYATYINEQFGPIHKALKILLTIMAAFLLHFFLFISCVMISESMTFVTRIIFYLYLSIVIFPNYSFTYVYTVLMFLFFIYRIMMEIESDYFNLLKQTIKAVKYLRSERSKLENKQFCDPTASIRSEMEVIGERSLDEGQYELKSRRQMPGIRKDLFNYVVQRHRPVHIALFIGIIQILVMMFVVITSIIFVYRYVSPAQTDDKHDIFHVVCVLLITLLPNLVHKIFTPHIDQGVRKLKVRQSVIDFYQHCKV